MKPSMETNYHDTTVVEETTESEDLDLPFDIRTLAFRLARRWKLLFSGAIIALFCGVLVALIFGNRVYQAEAVLQYRPSEVEQKPSNLLTLLNMVKLQENLEEVRQRLGLTTSLNSLSGAFKVDVRRDTELLVIEAEAGSPEEAARFAATLRDVFLESQESKRRGKLEGVQRSLEARLTEVTAELKAADKAMQEFTVKNQIVDLDKEAQWYLEELTSLQIMLEEAQVQRTSVRQKAENVDRIVGDLKDKVAREKAESQTEFDSLGDINIRVQRLRAAIHDDKTQRSGEALLQQTRLDLDRAEELKAKGLISDSDYEKKLAAYNSQKALTVDTEEVAEWKSQVDELNSKAIPKAGQQAQSGPILQEMMLKSFDIQLDLVTQDKRVARMEEAVHKARKRLNALPQLQRSFAALSREVVAAEAQKKDLEDRLGDTRRLLSSRLLDFVVASEPKLRPEPVSSNRRLLAVAGTLLAWGLVVLAILGREILDPRSVSGPELKARTGIRVFGVLPREIAIVPGRVENLLARELPQSGVLVFTTPRSGVDLDEACSAVGRALTYQGISTVLVGLNGSAETGDLSCFLLHGKEMPEPLQRGSTEAACVFRGEIEPAPSFYRSTLFQQYLRSLSTSFQLVIILAPDLQNSVCADILAEQADGVMVVVDTKTERGDIKKSTGRICQRVLGLVLSGVEAPFCEF
jgi:uncharacterized protein involved in exopolysaccharide biosynthesis